MIILGESMNGENVLHVITGHETYQQLSLNGNSIIDITEYLRHMDLSKPCKLLLNQCDSEEEVLHIVQEKEQRRQIMTAMKEFQNTLSEKSNIPTTTKQKNKKYNKQKHLKCPLCHEDGAAIIENGLVYPCETCQSIENGLKDNNISQPPSDDELQQIRNHLENENESQKESISKYLEEQEMEYGEDDESIED